MLMEARDHPLHCHAAARWLQPAMVVVSLAD
jgi:hypothetical protein